MKLSKKYISCLLVLICIFISVIFIYIQNYYHSEIIAYSYLENSEYVTVEKIDKGYFFDGPGEEKALIFYPGAKVQTESYSRLLNQIAENGIDTFLIDMPGRIAFFGKNYADNIIKNYNYDKWYIAGHSLGGVVASSYVSENYEKIDTLILLASYPTVKINDNVKIISIYGDCDEVLSKEKYEATKRFWSDNNDNIEKIILGGNHAQIGNYGKQKGDGDARITSEKEQDEIVWNILNN